MQINFKNSQRHQVLRERNESKERPGESGSIETERALIQQEGEKDSCADKQRSAHDQVEPKRPATVRFEVASHRIAQRHPRAQHDQNGHEAAAYVLRKVPNASADPQQIKARGADRKSGEDVEPPRPAMKYGKAFANLRNKLKRPGEDDKDGATDMREKRGVTHPVAANVAVRQDFVPGREIPPPGRESIEGSHGESKDELSNQNDRKPKARGGFQYAVRERIHF